MNTTSVFPAARRSGSRGFSLIELMIAMTIGFIVLAGIGFVYLESRSSFRSMENLSRMQESARYALDMMARDIRMAGYRGCASANVTVHNALNRSAESAYNFDLPMTGYDAVPGGWNPSLPTDSGGLSGLNILSGTDAIIVRSAFGGGATVTKQPGLNSSADLQVTAPNDLAINDIVMVTNCKAATVFQITNMNVNGAGHNVVHNVGATHPGNATKDLVENYAASGGEIVKMQSKTYFIRTGASGAPALWQYDNYRPIGGSNPAELADGVENLQIHYGIDANSDGVVESYVTADAVADWKLVAAVRISLLLSSRDDMIATGAQTYTYNGSQITASDRRLRQAFTTTVSVRNKTQ